METVSPSIARALPSIAPLSGVAVDVPHYASSSASEAMAVMVQASFDDLCGCFTLAFQAGINGLS